ncbi:hypothetical protein EDB19DRAFT_1688656 [Suillus lakei]|nr:hypothetical protein EDB19DRAFT_1688656 [Suillus lakei]
MLLFLNDFIWVPLVLVCPSIFSPLFIPCSTYSQRASITKNYSVLPAKGTALLLHCGFSTDLRTADTIPGATSAPRTTCFSGPVWH